MVRQRLFEAEIYPPVHWPIAGIVPSRFVESHRLNQEIMTLPCDQRYTTQDMDRIADIIVKTTAPVSSRHEPVPDTERQ